MKKDFPQKSKLQQENVFKNFDKFWKFDPPKMKNNGGLNYRAVIELPHPIEHTSE